MIRRNFGNILFYFVLFFLCLVHMSTIGSKQPTKTILFRVQTHEYFIRRRAIFSEVFNRSDG